MLTNLIKYMFFLHIVYRFSYKYKYDKKYNDAELHFDNMLGDGNYTNELVFQEVEERWNISLTKEVDRKMPQCVCL